VPLDTCIEGPKYMGVGICFLNNNTCLSMDTLGQLSSVNENQITTKNEIRISENSKKG
jgi:hypothetical protein